VGHQAHYQPTVKALNNIRFSYQVCCHFSAYKYIFITGIKIDSIILSTLFSLKIIINTLWLRHRRRIVGTSRRSVYYFANHEEQGEPSGNTSPCWKLYQHRGIVGTPRRSVYYFANHEEQGEPSGNTSPCWKLYQHNIHLLWTNNQPFEFYKKA
jgi:hypothetical protein